MFDWIGWVATAIFVTSYFSKRTATLRGIQALAAIAWIVYGVLVHAIPVIGANVVVTLAAGFSAWREYTRSSRPEAIEARVSEV